jgi:pilus assembly protein Flp/PilA
LLASIWQASREENSALQPDLAPQMLTTEWAMRGLMKLLRCEKGANAIEYALVATLISIAAISAFHNLGNKIDTMYNNVGNAM